MKYDGKFASRWRAKSPDALCAVLPKIYLIEGHRVSVICNDGRVYEGFGAVPCIGEDENGEETDAVRLDLNPSSQAYTRAFSANFAAYCVKNTCRTTARLRIFALSATKLCSKIHIYFL